MQNITDQKNFQNSLIRSNLIGQKYNSTISSHSGSRSVAVQLEDNVKIYVNFYNIVEI